MLGKFVVRGTRLAVKLLLRMYPQLEIADVEAASQFADRSNPSEQLACPAT